MYEWLNDTVLIECTEHFVIVGTGNEINQFGGGLTEVNAIETRTRNAAGPPISQPQATLPPPPQRLRELTLDGAVRRIVFC